jgi:transposase
MSGVAEAGDIGWQDAELAGASLPDQRLGRRLRRLLDQLSSAPGQPVPAACGDWAATKAAYRFFDNPRVTEHGVLAGHFAATAARCAASEGPILILQDTTEFIYGRARPGKIGFTKTINGGRYKAGQPNVLTLCGVLMHSSLAVSLAGTPLGLTAVKFWTRTKFKGTWTLKRHVIPIPCGRDSEAVRRRASRIPCGELGRFAMPVPLRSDFDATALRRVARKSKDGPQARRLLALAAIYEGASRTEAARIGGVTLQIVRDWVVKFNAYGPEGLIDRKPPGQPSRLTDAPRAALMTRIDDGPIPSVHGVVRWRLVDLIQWLWEEFRVTISKQTLSRELRALRYRKLSARPRHHARSEAEVSAFKKPSPPVWRRSRQARPEARR